jgi:hypothetical protein
MSIIITTFFRKRLLLVKTPTYETAVEGRRSARREKLVPVNCLVVAGVMTDLAASIPHAIEGPHDDCALQRVCYNSSDLSGCSLLVARP